MKLFKFPYLVQQEILQNLDYSDLFLLSFVSKKTKELIKSSQFSRFENIHLIKYDCDYEGQIFVYIHPRDSWEKEIVRFVERKETHNDYFQLNVSGGMVYFRFSSWIKYLKVYFYEQEREPFIKSIHNYFLDFFGSSVEYQWMACEENPPIPPLQHLSASVNMLVIGYDFAETENLENFLSSCPVWKYINIDNMKRTELFSPESKFYHAEFVNSKQSDHDNPAILRYFQGKQAVIKCSFCEITDLVEFVNGWISGETFQKLEYLNIEIRSNEIPQNQFFNEIGAKYIAAIRKPPTHTLPKVHVEDDRKLYTDPITSHIYVVREGDNLVASVLIQGGTFSFGVWDKTETEFLEMIY